MPVNLRTDFMDARLLGLAENLGLRRPYFDMKERLRARLKEIDTDTMRKHNAIFIHVPKCAGTTIVDQVPIAAWHYSATLMRKSDPDLWRSAFTFGFVRDPYDRLVSAFHYLRSPTAHPRDRAWGAANLGSFETFQNFMNALERPSRRHQLLNWVHFLPQTYYLCDRRNRILVDFVGKTEEFDSDLDAINRRSSLALKNLHKNKTDRPEDRPFYTRSSAHLVEEIYLADFQTFGYEARRY